MWRLSGRFRERLRDLGEQDAREAALTRLLGGKPDWSRVEPYAPASKDAGMIAGRYVGVGALSHYRDGPQVGVLEDFEGRFRWFRTPSTEALWALDKLDPGAIMTVAPREPELRASDVTIAEIAEANGGRYSAALHKQARPADRDVFIERHVRRLEALSREGAAERVGDGAFQLRPDYLDLALIADRARFGAVSLEVSVLDARSVERQVGHDGSTFLDGVLARPSIRLGEVGFGRDLARAVEARRETLVGFGLATREAGGSVRFAEGWRAELFKREMAGVFAGLERDRGKPADLAKDGVPFAGVYNDRAQVGAVSYAVFEGRHTVTLAPWRPALEGARGQMVTAAWDGRSVDFALGNQLQGQIGRALGRDLGLEL